MEFEPSNSNEEASIFCYYNTVCHVKFCLTWQDGLAIKLEENRKGNLQVVELKKEIPQGTIYLKVSVSNICREFYYSQNGTNWILVGIIEDSSFLCNEGTSHFGFTETMVGIYAKGPELGRELYADFSSFLVNKK